MTESASRAYALEGYLERRNSEELSYINDIVLVGIYESLTERRDPYPTIDLAMTAGYRHQIAGDQQRLNACTALVTMLGNALHADPDNLPGGEFKTEIASLAPDVEAQDHALRRWAEVAVHDRAAALDEHKKVEDEQIAWQSKQKKPGVFRRFFGLYR